MTRLRIASTFFLALTLSACGGQYDIDPAHLLASVVATSAAPVAVVSPIASPGAVPGRATASMPAPDCAPEGCAGLRIIDGNAEAWRIDAGRRAARAGAPPLS